MSGFFDNMSDAPAIVQLAVGILFVIAPFVLGFGAIAAVVFVIVLLTDWYYCIPAGHRGVLRRGKRLIGVYDHGVGFKRPIWDTMKLVDVRLRTLTSGMTKVETYEKLGITVGCNVTYGVSDCAKFSANPLEEEAAATLLSKVIADVAERYGIKSFAEHQDLITADLHATLIERTMEHGLTIGDPELTIVLPDDPVRAALELRLRSEAIALAASQLEQLPAVTAVRT